MRVHDVWIAKRCCDCRPYDWTSEIYAERQRLGGSTKGYPLKLGLNSLYGTRAQRSGRGPYHDIVEAGLITAITRARIVEAIGRDPEAVVMIATDAVFSTRPLALDLGRRRRRPRKTRRNVAGFKMKAALGAGLSPRALWRPAPN